MAPESLFRARQTAQVPSVAQTVAAPRELTKNARYCVSRLPALPHSLKENETIINGYSDRVSGYAVAVGESSVHVWNYASADSLPLLFQFAVSEPPLVILTLPVGPDRDPGLAIIVPSGLVTFYESLQHSPALGLIHNRALELALDINTSSGEYITLAESVEPAGIAIATNWKRVVLVLVRDFRGKPRLSATELLKPSVSSGIFRFFGKLSPETRVGDEIVSIRAGRVANTGLTQKIVVQDSMGQFSCFTYHLLSAHSEPYVDTTRTIKQNLGQYLENSLDGYLPGSTFSIKFLDLWPQDDNIYIALAYIDDAFANKNVKNLLLLSARIDSSGVLFYGTHRLLRFDPKTAVSLTNKPRLYIPLPGVTAFVIVDNSVILTDIDTAYIQSQDTARYYRPRWEDIVRLKSSVRVIGQGYEDKTSKKNPALVLLTSNSGVLRVERFPENASDMDIDSDTAVDPVGIVKSHIEQGIFYHESASIDFGLKEEDFEDSVIVSAIQKVTAEILDSSSPYLPSFLPSIKDLLALKSSALRELISYTAANFQNHYANNISGIVQSLEKVDVALNLWAHINEEPSATELLKKELVSAIEASEVLKSSEQDTIRSFFSEAVESINFVLTDLIVRLVGVSYSVTNIISLLDRTLYSGVFVNEEKYILNSTLAVRATKSWVFETDLIVFLQDIFKKAYNKKSDGLANPKSRQSLVHLTEVLYYFVTSAISFMGSETTENDQLEGYVEWYKSLRTKWIGAMLQGNLEAEAIAMAEKYRDFSSVARVLEQQKDEAAEKYGDKSPEYSSLLDQYEAYVEKYGYEFASQVYENYLQTDKIQPLLLEKHSQYLKKYIRSNKDKTLQIAWIRDLVEEDFENAAEGLVKSDNKEDNQENRELKFSLAKLSAIAAKSNTMRSDLVDEYLSEAESNLVTIRIQNGLFEAVVGAFLGQKELLKLDYVLKNLTNSSVDKSTSRAVIEKPYETFVNNKPLDSVDLINFLTLIKPTGFTSGFSNALKIASLLPNESSFKHHTRVVWLRLLTTTDDWLLLAATQENTDEYNKSRIHDTFLYKTLVAVGENEAVMGELEVLLSSKQDALSLFEDGIVLERFNESLLSKLETNLEKYQLAGWIDSMRTGLRTRHLRLG